MRNSPHFQFRFSLETASYLPYHSQLASFLVRILRRASLDQSSDIMAGSFRSLSSSWIILMAASFHVSSSHAFVPSAIPSPGNRRHHSPSSLTALSQKDAIRSTTAPLISINPDHDDDDDNDNLLLTRFQKIVDQVKNEQDIHGAKDIGIKVASLAGSMGKASLDLGKETLSIMANITIVPALKEMSTKKNEKRLPLLMESDDDIQGELDLWDEEEEMLLDDAFNLDPERTKEMNARPFESNALNSYYNSLVQESVNTHKDSKDEEATPTNEEPLHKFDLPRALAAKTVTEFDDAFIAPIYDFEDCWDYYRKTSSGYFLESIAVPSFVLNAKDDPFFDPAAHPVEKTVLFGGKAPVQIHRTDYGGHCGFCFQQYDESEDGETSLPNVSWMPSELARFLQHVLDQKQE